MKQLALTVGLSAPNSFTNYLISPANKIAVNTLKQLAIAGAGPVVGLQGGVDAGKSHLLQACCALVNDNTQVACLSMRDLLELPPAAVLENLHNLALVAIDDIDLAFGNKPWEEALFHFYNRLIDSGNSLLFTVRKPLKDYDNVLPDLVSRLAIGLIFGLKPLNDEQLEAMFVLRANNLGISLSDEVVSYVFRHCNRSAAALIQFLQQLDQLSLSARKKPTVPLVKTLINQINA